MSQELLQGKNQTTTNHVYFVISIVLEVTFVLVNVPVNVLGAEASRYKMTHIHTIESLLTYKTFPWKRVETVATLNLCLGLHGKLCRGSF